MKFLLLAAGALAALAGLTFPGFAATDGAAPVAAVLAGLPAFPGAQGFGSTTPGGRGGRVLFVTNLDDSGPGSLRAACEAEGPRIVLFQVAGTIALKRALVVRHPYLTLAGQTAPGDGICLRDYPFEVATHDVIVRYLRSRLGDVTGQAEDCIDFYHGASNSIFDHCSATWSIDECLSLSGRDSNLTIQWCLIGESLNRSKHPKGEHGYGSLSRANGPVSWHDNLWVHNDARNPRLGDNYGRPPYPVFDVRNNLIYDYGKIASGLTQGRLHVNYVGNYLRPGPSSTARTPIRVGGPSELVYFIRGNVFEGHADLTADNDRFFDPVTINGKVQVQTVDTPFPAAPVTTVPAAEVPDLVLASVGASLPVRDPVDTRIVAEVRSRGGHIIDSQTEVGGWPVLKTAPPPLDSDHDGMPDAWEIQHGLNPHDPADAAADNDHDGYTNLEEYLNGTDPNQYVDYRDPKNNVNTLGTPAARM
jgi:Bacterial TSP3 repeat